MLARPHCIIPRLVYFHAYLTFKFIKDSNLLPILAGDMTEMDFLPDLRWPFSLVGLALLEVAFEEESRSRELTFNCEFLERYGKKVSISIPLQSG